MGRGQYSSHLSLYQHAQEQTLPIVFPPLLSTAACQRYFSIAVFAIVFGASAATWRVAHSIALFVELTSPPFVEC